MRPAWPTIFFPGLFLSQLFAGAVSAQEPPAASPAPSVRRAVEWKEFDYTCEGGAKLTVYVHNETVKVLFKNHLYLMKQVISASGTRYADGKTVWWSKGEGGFLQHDSPDGNGEMIVKDCQLNKPVNSSAIPSVVTGTVSYRLRMALPPDAIIQVQLQDEPRANAPGTVIAEDKIILGERQVPVPFELKVDPAKIDRHHTYAVNARIVVEDQLRFSNDREYRVLTQGNPSQVEMILEPVETNTPRSP